MNLSDALAALEGRKEFAVRRNDGLVTINYVVQMPGTFDGIRADFRGITFDEATGECVSRPLHKFFNVNQTPGTMFDRIKDRQAAIFEKLDGTLIHFLRHKGELLAASRMGPWTDHARMALALASGMGLLGRIGEAVDEGFTPMFEFCSPRYPIVVRHASERLVFLCDRHRESGAYSFAHAYPDSARHYTFPLANLMSHLESKRDFEGYVCWLDDGTAVKAKCNWYLERHRAFDVMLRPAYKIYGMVFDGVMDDIIAAAQPHHRASLERIYNEAQSDFLAERERVEVLAGERARRKAFVEMIRRESPDDLGASMRLYDGQSPDDAIRARLMAGYKARYPTPIIADGEEG